jgi:hypothetical protein
MRQLVYEALMASDELRDEVDNRIFAASNVDYQGKKPLIVLRSHTSFPIARAEGRGLGSRTYLQLWVHDKPGSYVRIDKVLSICRKVLEAMPPQDNFLEATWIESGVDLRDDQMETITRYSRFQITETIRELA